MRRWRAAMAGDRCSGIQVFRCSGEPSPAPEHLNTRTPEHPPPAIEAEGLTKHFGPRAAVDGVTFQVQPGEIFGLVGPDGAGKTTTMRLLLGLLPADGGAARVLGHDMLADPEAARPELGYVSQRFSLYGDLTVAENIAFAADLRRVSRSDLEERARKLLALTELAPF